jgi:hypothetical protein
MFNFLKLLIRQKTRKPVGDEVLDRTVPLDGNDLARLINLRVARSENCKCDHCADFLSEVQFKGKAAKEHANEAISTRHWNGSPSKERSTGEFTPDELLDLQPHGKVMEKLIQAEQTWQREHGTKCVDSDDYWINRCQSNCSDKDPNEEALELQGYHI